MKKFYFMACIALATIETNVAQVKDLFLEVNSKFIVHRMAGGIGASWHALVKDIPLENEKYDYPVRMINPRGSAFAGNPPVSDTAAWNQLYRHANWLGLNFIRVELSQHMYQPEKNTYDWDNEEMQVLYKILDWCEANGAIVFLQQMWGHVAWNAFPGVHPLLSAPKSLDDYANGIATLLEYLTNTKKYTCIWYFCITNEPPGGPWGYWWSYGSGSGSVTPAWKKVRETLDQRGIKIPLSGPDWVSLPELDTKKIDFAGYLGAFDIHSYFGVGDEGEMILSDWAKWAHSQNKPFFVTELGNMNLGWGKDHPGPKTFKAALSNASDIIHGLNAEVDGFNRWSFTNRGDMDGQWQLVRTYDIENKVYLKTIVPENSAYYGYGIITRFLKKHAATVQWFTKYCIKGVKPAAFLNTDGNLVILLVNTELSPVRLNLTVAGDQAKKTFQVYQVTEELVSAAGYRMDPVKSIKGLDKQKVIDLLPGSITVITTYNLRHEDMAIK